MRGIGAAVDAHLPIIAPSGLARGRVMQHRKLVDILTFGVVRFTKEPGFGHRLHQHIGLHVDIVFRHHIDRFAALGRLHQPARLVDRDGGGYFAEHMDIALQGRDRLSNMKVHGRRHHDHIRLGLVQHAFVNCKKLGDARSFASFGERLFMQIAQGDDFGFWVGLEGAEKGTRTPRTGKGNFDLGHDAILLFVVC